MLHRPEFLQHLPRPVRLFEEQSLARTVTPPGINPSWESTKWGTPPGCRPGSEPEGGVCDPTMFCPSGFSRNSRTGWCDPENIEEYKCNFDVSKPFCGPDHYYDRPKGRCVPCACEVSKGMTPNYTGPGCIYRYSGKPCCPGKDPAAPCVSDRVWNDQGECVGRDLPHCKIYGPLAKWDADQGKCVCPEGYERDEISMSCRQLTPPSPNPPPEVQAEDNGSDFPFGTLAVGILLGACGFLVKNQITKSRNP